MLYSNQKRKLLKEFIRKNENSLFLLNIFPAYKRIVLQKVLNIKEFLHGTGHRQNLSSMSFILSTHIYFIVVRSQLNARRATLRLVMTTQAHSRETDYKEKPQNLLYLVNSLFSLLFLCQCSLYKVCVNNLTYQWPLINTLK